MYCYKVRENRDRERLAELFFAIAGSVHCVKGSFQISFPNFSPFSNITPKNACKSLILKAFYIVRVVFPFLTLLVSP